MFVLAPPGSLTLLLCCAESELNSENSVQLRLCFLLSAARTSYRDLKYCTLSFNCVQVQTLPTAQVTSALTDSFFSWGYDPYTHACKARPLTTVGWTSLSVIVIVIVIDRRSDDPRRCCLADIKAWGDCQAWKELDGRSGERWPGMDQDDGDSVLCERVPVED